MTRHRTRSIKFERKLIGKTIDPNTGNIIYADYMDWSPYLTQSHNCMDDTHPGPPYNEVGPLSVIHMNHPGYNNLTDSGTTWSGLLDWVYTGGFWVSLGINPGDLSDEASAYNNMSMDALGATGWKKYKPAKPIADVGVMLGESRELPRQLRDAAKTLYDLAHHANSAVRNMSWLSNQHLAIQFGWLPLMRDLEKLANAAACTDLWLKRVRKYNGQWEHRGGIVAQGEKSYVYPYQKFYLFPMPTTLCYPPEGLTPGDMIVTTGYKVWFSAWFKYYIADFASASTQLRLRSRIYGLTNTPLIVWNLLPWSWLVDWFTNLGDNIDNLIPADGLVAKMPCVMRYCYTRRECYAQQRWKQKDGSFKTFAGNNYHVCETKSRSVASPFGFGLTADSLSARQWSILAALGIKYS